MHPNPALVAAATSPAIMQAAQICGLAAADEWRARDDVRALMALLDDWIDNSPASADVMADAVQPWLTDQCWLNAFMATMVDALRADPLTALQFRMVQGRVAHGLVVLQSGAAEVTLNWIDGQQLPLARDRHVLFTPALSVVAAVGQPALQTQMHRLEEGHPPTMRSAALRQFASGEVLAIDCRHEALSLFDADGDAVLLRINLRLPFTDGQTAFDIASGQPMALAMGDDGACRMLPLLAIARLAGRPKRAVAALTALTQDDDAVLRWAAMRELLVADTRTALPLLHAMASGDTDDGVRHTAKATHHMLFAEEAASCQA
jgi:hypothetical protein